MKIIRINRSGNCQFVYFDWKKFKFKTTCWAKNLDSLFGKNNNRKHIFIGIYNM